MNNMATNRLHMLVVMVMLTASSGCHLLAGYEDRPISADERDATPDAALPRTDGSVAQQDGPSGLPDADMALYDPRRYFECSGGLTLTRISATMVACTSKAITVSQCDRVCPPNWHGCTTSEYLAAGGDQKQIGVGTIRLWLGFCLDDEDGPLPEPRPTICGSCMMKKGAPVIWESCDNDLTTVMELSNMGLATDSRCHESLPSTAGARSIAGHFFPTPSYAQLPGFLCCAPPSSDP
jgi:hypothetical protein